MTPTQEWIDRHTASPETLTTIRKQRTRKMPQAKGKGGMADRYLGICPPCKGPIMFSHLYIRRDKAGGRARLGGTAYHTDCDPNKPAPTCWCGGETEGTATEHQECFNARADAHLFTRALAGIFSPRPVAKFPRMRA